MSAFGEHAPRQREEQQGWSYRDFLALRVTEEIAQRQQTRIASMVRCVDFPFLKTIDDSLLGSALAPDFVAEGRCLIFGGNPGGGNGSRDRVSRGSKAPSM